MNGNRLRSPFPAGQPFRIEVYNDRGTRMHGETTQAVETRVSTSAMPTGLYHVRLRRGNNTVNYNLSVQH
ncbi:T9SS C-terminal target domain-containing protein [Hymenobacter lapidiphilus]|uniref:T9SS type A sorting domain-containing protein n=1 Tax=Hymenobacter sp. CCM 8763 TaxID=2303334 RepID=UPI000E3512A0|nr:T9SS type A sorting domain-containing protein [Hymenobacter sp. CCM 8763]RFP63632.1 T9SS C-terminal target domain-containing protein [Hymenobacter sp. CCM 8763]